MIKKSTILKIFNILFWLLIGSGLSFLLISAITKEKVKVCKQIEIEFLDEKLINMIDKQEVHNSLWPSQSNRQPLGKQITSFDLFALENQLSKNPWIENADLYFDNQDVLHIDIQQKQPVARLFTPEGSSYYLDNHYSLLPLKSTDHIALPVFTNFYINPAGMKRSDSATIERITSLSNFILNDSFWLAQIESIYIKPDNGFELSTQVGDHTIELGVRNDWSPMFNKLKLLYQKLNREQSWNRYTNINLQYKDQVVCERSSAKMIVADSTQLDSTQITVPVLNTNINQNTNPSKK